jgi:hypothetical protein
MPSLQATDGNGLPPFYPLPLNHPPLAIDQALDGHRRDQTNPMDVSFIHQLVEHDDGWLNTKQQGHRLSFITCHLENLEWKRCLCLSQQTCVPLLSCWILFKRKPAC